MRGWPPTDELLVGPSSERQRRCNINLENENRSWSSL